MNNLVSVIVPVYNTRLYLKKCIDSILNQTYKNLEIILVDDGSIDGSNEILKKYCKIDNRISLIEQKHSGVSSARNAGLKAIKGDFYCFVDSDDFVEPNFINELYNCIIKYNVKIAECSYKYYDSGVLYKSHSYGPDGKYYWETNANSYNFAINNKMFKNCFKNFCFPTNYTIGEDSIYGSLVLSKSKCFAITNKTNYCLNNRDNSLTHDKDNDFNEFYNIEMLFIRLLFFYQNGMSSKYLNYYFYSYFILYLKTEKKYKKLNKKNKEKTRKRVINTTYLIYNHLNLRNKFLYKFKSSFFFFKLILLPIRLLKKKK